jgi:hypothetical protein
MSRSSSVLFTVVRTIATGYRRKARETACLIGAWTSKTCSIANVKDFDFDLTCIVPPIVAALARLKSTECHYLFS